MAGEEGDGGEQMSVRDLKLDTKDDGGGEGETQREKAIRERPKQREKGARACIQTPFQKGDEKDRTANYRVVKYGSVGIKSAGTIEPTCHQINKARPNSK